ncbi:MAG: acyl carrier protein [Deltaproteobacteria bacterium]|nr:acyl carrier protein [Deltaproteobacteria bacterium]
MLVKRLKLKMDPDAIKDDAPLFGEGDNGLGLDSIDALELVVGIQKEYGIVISDKAVAEKVLVNVNTIAEYVKTTKA